MKLVPVIDDRSDQRSISTRVALVVQSGRGRFDIALEEHGRAIVHRVADRVTRLDPAQPAALQRGGVPGKER